MIALDPLLTAVPSQRETHAHEILHRTAPYHSKGQQEPAAAGVNKEKHMYSTHYCWLRVVPDVPCDRDGLEPEDITAWSVLRD